MRKQALVVVLTILAASVKAQDIPAVKLEVLKTVYTNSPDTTYIVNFFATWCGPCIQEIPVLNSFAEKNKEKPYALLYVSLDHSKSLKKLPSFAKKHKLGRVYVMNESADYSWLPEVDRRWQGSIPATLIINKSKNIKVLIEKPMETGELDFYLIKMGL